MENCAFYPGVCLQSHGRGASTEAKADLCTVRDTERKTGSRAEERGRAEERERQGPAGWKNSPHLPSPALGPPGGRQAWKRGRGKGQPPQRKKVEECLQLRPRINKPHSGSGGGGRHVSLLKLERARGKDSRSPTRKQAPRGPVPPPEHLSQALPSASWPKPRPFLHPGPQFPRRPREGGAFRTPRLCLCRALPGVPSARSPPEAEDGAGRVRPRAERSGGAGVRAALAGVCE